MGSDQMGPAPGSGRAVSISNWTLTFNEPPLEHAFKVHQRRVWSSTELWRLKVNLLAGIINLSITSYMLSQVGRDGLHIAHRACGGALPALLWVC